MIRTRCEYRNSEGVQCVKMSRARIKHVFCRACHKIKKKHPRALESRTVLRGGYRRVRARRRIAKVAAPKVMKKGK